MTRWAKTAFLLFFSLAPIASLASTCNPLEFDTRSYVVCDVAAGQDVRLFLKDTDGETIGSFDRLGALLAAEGKQLVFAMNAGMYHPDRRPVGLYIENGVRMARLITSEGPGNFGMLPNGVFCIDEARFSVIESRKFEATAPNCRFASQSGPMLVIGGALHPRFLAQSDSTRIRNGVGVSANGLHAWFVMSDGPVNFFDFARVFRDALGVPEALYFDGNISRLYAPELNRDDFGFPMGPIVGLSADAD